MADNTTMDPGVGGAVFASNDIGGVQFPRVKLIHGAADVNDGDVASGNPLPTTEENSADALTSLQLIDDAVAAEGAALSKGVLMQVDDGTDRINCQGNAGGDLKVTLDSEVVDVIPAAPDPTAFLPVRLTDGTSYGSKTTGWDADALAVQRGLAFGVTATTDQTLLAQDGSNLYNVVDLVVTIFAGTAAPGAKAYVSLYHGTSAAGTEFARIYAPVLAGEVVTAHIPYVMPDRGAVNQAVTADLSASLGANGEYSVTVHAYKTAS